MEGNLYEGFTEEQIKQRKKDDEIIRKNSLQELLLTNQCKSAMEILELEDKI